MKKRIALFAVFQLVRMLSWTYRFRVVGKPPAAFSRGHGYVLAIWHQNLFGGILAQTGRRHVVIISRSRDGDPVAYLCGRLGHLVVRGSSRKRGVDKGGKEAKDEMIEALRRGVPGAVTVDGPSGPAFEVKPGIIDMARQSGVPIIPYVPLPASYWTFRSWDRFRLPKPFSRIDILYGEPLLIGAGADFSEHQQGIAETLVSIEREHQLSRQASLAAAQAS